MLTHDAPQACARDLPISDTDTSPPWKEMSGAWNKWISEEYWPKDWPVGDPGNYGVPKCRTILQTWFERQERGEIPFQFHSYWVGGEEWLPREPRRDAFICLRTHESLQVKIYEHMGFQVKGKATFNPPGATLPLWAMLAPPPVADVR